MTPPAPQRLFCDCSECVRDGELKPRIADPSFNPIRGGEWAFFGPPSGFSCATAKRRKTESSYLLTFSKHSLRTFWHKKSPGQVMSGHKRQFVDPTSEKFAILPELEFFTDRFLFIFSLGYNTQFVYLKSCIYVT